MGDVLDSAPLKPFCAVEGCYNLRQGRLCSGHRYQARAGNPFTVLPSQKTAFWQVPQCSFGDCEKFALQSGFCTGHYAQKKRGEEMRPLRFKGVGNLEAGRSECIFEGCNLPSHLTGFCKTHYWMWTRGVELRPIGEDLECPVGDCVHTYTRRSRVELCRAHVRVLRLYNLTMDRLLEMYEGGSFCEICGDRTSTAIDHDHACCAGDGSCGQCVRGTLCLNCNHMLGSAKDNLGTLRKAVSYLEGFAARSLRLAG